MLSPQFTFLISVAWNQQGLPLIQDKLALGSEIMIKTLLPFMGQSLLFQLSCALVILCS
jgi:hypothetical protein